MANSNNTSEMQDILDFFRKADQYIQRSTFKNVVLILGNTGSEKSTFIQYISGNYDNLRSQQEGDSTSVFTISDHSSKINLESSTTPIKNLPKLIADSTTDVAYYDCPGFSDGTNITHEIFSKYFMKKIIDSTDTIKLVLTINYSSVNNWSNREDFMQLLKHVLNMINNVEKFKDSIALVVTKIDNQFENEVLVSDETIKNNIVFFLTIVKNELKHQLDYNYFPNEREFNKNAIKFIDILLQKEGDNFTRIGLFRRSNQPAQVSKIISLQYGKKSLDKILHNNIQFIKHNEKDFSYNLSLDLQNKVSGLIEKINENINSSIASIGGEIQKYYYLQEKHTYDIQEIYDKFKVAHDALCKVKIIPAKFIKHEDLIKQMFKSIENLKIPISSKNFINIIDYTRYLTFIDAGRSEMSIKPIEWARGLTNVLKYLDNSQKWYKFLINLHNALSTYEVQQDISQYTKLANDFQYKIEANQIEANKKILKQIIKQIVKKDLENEFSDIQDIEIDDLKLKYLNKLLDLSLNYKTSSAYDDNTQNLLIKGEFVKLSEATKLAKNYSDLKSIEIFALNKVFIDDNLNKTVTLSIIAPLWEIVGTRHIILDGKPGEAHEVAKAKNGIGFGTDGYNGKPGKPGGSAGHFLGIGDTFINNRFLNISANGGKGGPAQDGGDGAPGQDGSNPTILEDKPRTCDVCDGDYNYNCKKKKCGERESAMSVGSLSTQTCTYLFYGTQGGNGGNGGNGGRWGDGGHAGNIIVSASNNYMEILKSNNTGSIGYKGVGGIGGKGGRNGDYMMINCIRTAIHGTWISPAKMILQNGENSKGNKGKNGVNDEHVQKSELVPFLNPSYTVNKYKSYLRENLSSNIRKSVLQKFLDQFENRKEVIDLYDTLGLVNELQGLEDQYFKMHKNLSFLPFYKSLLSRIIQYADKSAKDSLENRKVLSYLYTATLSKICSINNGADYLVVDIQKYLTLRIDDIKKLRELNNVSTINNFKLKYQREIKKKTNEAKEFIDKEITPEINNLIDQLDNQIESLIDETVARQNSEKEKRKDLIEQQKQLENALMLRKILGVVRIASQFLSFTGPVGTLIASAADTGSGIVSDALVLDDSHATGIEEIGALPGAVKVSLSRVSDQLKNKQQVFKEQLNNVEKKLKEFSDDESNNIKTIKVKVRDTQAALDREIAKGATLDPKSVDKIYTLRKEVTELLETEKKALQERNSNKDLKNSKRLRMIGYVQNLVNIGDISIGVYKKIKNDQDKINNLGKVIKQADENINKLIQYEKDIYNTIIPTCRNLRNSVETMSDNLQKQSHVALDISKWKIQSTIRDVKFQLQTMIKGFKIEENFVHCMDKLEEGMSTMVNVYNRIEDYHDKAELAAYIADINSDKAMGITVENDELNNAIDNLKLVIQSNLILEKYELAVNAFQQSIFPFADLYLGEFNLPTSLKSNDTENVISHAITIIEQIKSKISEYNASVKDYDKYIHKNVEFNSLRKQTSPLYVWKHSMNKHIISKLLEGEEITLKADITNGLDKNAIKFNEIGIRLKSANYSIQQDLEKHLQDYQVIMTHLGNSYYRCNSNLYSITSNKQTISYYYAKNNKEESLDKNVVHDKIKSNEPILSPYTMWQIKLTNVTKDFNTLANYKNYEIDLELEGRAQYIDQGIDVCDNLDKYYTLDNTLSQLNNIDDFTAENADQGLSLLSSPTVSHGQEGHSRSRRSVNEHGTIQYSENHVFMASSASTNIESSFLNNLINVIGTKLIYLKNSNLMNQITKWFINKESSTGQKIFDTINQTTTIMQELQPSNIPSLCIYLPENSERLSKFIDYKESASKINITNDSLLYNHGNLLLLDLVSRSKSGVKYRNTAITVTNDLNLDFAQNLAYKHHILKNKVNA